MTDAPAVPCTGLDAQQVAERKAKGQTNDLPPRSGRSVIDIVRANVFTRINAILAVLLGVVLFTGSLKNSLFGLLIVANSAIGIIQEVRAKRTLDALAIVGEAHPTVRRDGVAVQVDQRELVLDDVIEIGPGDQVVVDGEVLQAVALEMDEALLTGEADPVAKHPGDRLSSGSFVSAGSGCYRATAVGADAYAVQLAEQARKFTLVDSELRSGIDKILKVIGFLLVPTGALTIWVQLTQQHNDLRRALLGMVAALVPMVPEGLVLMTSIAFAVGVVRLGRRQCLVQELPAIEGLARVDVVCADKTGTLTENVMEVQQVEALGETDPMPLLAALAAADPRPNASMAAVIEYAGAPARPASPTSVIAFSSARKWSGAEFGEYGTVIIGAPDVLAPGHPQVAPRVERLNAQGLRVLLLVAGRHPLQAPDVVAHTDPVALVVIGQRVRPDAAQTIGYFTGQGVRVKVISGDNADSVAAVTRGLGVGTVALDARTLPTGEQEFARRIEEGDVFGRVTPEQKRAMVHALQQRGHTVAMTGDGVNDVLALKDADIGVAMGSGSQASRSAAQIVLLDNSFATLPHVVAEGRRVIGNIERVATLFLTKTVYSVLLALLVGLSGLPFPFVPLHVTITAWFTIGIPAFLLSLAPNHDRARTGFVDRVMRRALPGGVLIGLASFATYLLLHFRQVIPDASANQVSTSVLIVLITMAMWVLTKVARMDAPWKVALVAAGCGAYLVMFTVPPLSSFFQLDIGSPGALMVSALVAGVGILALEAAWWLLGSFREIDRQPG